MRVDDTIQKQTDKTNKNKPLVHNIFILDCSASMFPYRYEKESKYSAALQGINEELKALASNKDVDFTHSLVEFGEKENIRFSRWIENNNSPLNERSQHLGNTALNDAIYNTIEKIIKEKDKEDKVLLKVFTDGEENCSRKNYNDVKNLIEKAKESNITVTFIGTEYDTRRAISNYNLSKGNTHTHDNTPKGISNLTSMRVGATMSYAKSVADGLDIVEDFYSKTVEK